MRLIVLVLMSLSALVCCSFSFADAAPTAPDVNATEQIAQLLFACFMQLPAMAQAFVMAVTFLAVLIPQIAPITPWTWDDRTIQYKGTITRWVLRLWNLAAGNWGRAANKSGTDMR